MVSQVAIDRMKMERKVMHIDATIICERDSHKGIIIGKPGQYAQEDRQHGAL